MWAHDFKAGVGNSSGVPSEEEGGDAVGVLVQANYGARAELRIAGVPVARRSTGYTPELRSEREGDGSIIIVVATNARLLSHQLSASHDELRWDSLVATTAWRPSDGESTPTTRTVRIERKRR